MSAQPSTASVEGRYRYRFSPGALAPFLLLAVVVYAGFASAIDFMVGQWNMDEFSHGYLIPFISAFLIWQRRAALQTLEFKGSWAGCALVLAGLALGVAGRLSSLYPIQHVALLVVITGLVLALAGRPGLRLLGAPLGVLVFMIPLPNMLLNALSSELQLISSSLGVWMIRLAGVAVLLEGNVIDLGNYKLEVAEACSGLRYLLPLMTLAFLMACFFRAAWWKRLLLFISSIPITLLMNSLRVAAIGIMVDRWGPGMAEGLLHEVQGWMVFMLSTGVLVLEVVWLAGLGGSSGSWRMAFGLQSQPLLPPGVPRRQRVLPAPLLAAAGAVLIFTAASIALPSRAEASPPRETFVSFPLRLGGWSGRREAMDRVYLDTLKLDDYLLADYVDQVDQDGAPVNLYVAWYDRQRAGDATHSPRACLPGGGWRIEDLRQIQISRARIGAEPLRVNRALIQYADQRELVYYWFEQRGRVVTNEYMVKWYLLVDALLRHRTDGALVRLIIPIPTAMSTRAADGELQRFAIALAPRLAPYIPS